MRTALALSLVVLLGLPAAAETYQLPRRSLRDDLVASKPNPSYYTFASFVVPGSAQLFLGDYPKAGYMLAGAAGAWVGVPYLTSALGMKEDSALGFQLMGILLWGGWSAYDAYLSSLKARERIDLRIQALDGSSVTNFPSP